MPLRYLAAQHCGPALPDKRHDQHRHNQPRAVVFRRHSLPVSQHLPRLDRLAPFEQEQVGVDLDWTEAAGRPRGTEISRTTCRRAFRPFNSVPTREAIVQLLTQQVTELFAEVQQLRKFRSHSDPETSRPSGQDDVCRYPESSRWPQEGTRTYRGGCRTDPSVEQVGSFQGGVALAATTPSSLTRDLWALHSTDLWDRDCREAGDSAHSGDSSTSSPRGPHSAHHSGSMLENGHHFSGKPRRFWSGYKRVSPSKTSNPSHVGPSSVDVWNK